MTGTLADIVASMPREPLHRALGLTDEEAERIVRILGRAPNDLELAMYAVMWSEHCSYKSSRIHLRRLPSDAPHVLVGPGENAGVVDVGDGIAVALRIESHNHPSAIEPYQGAATGVGGILRDVFSMGARPVALFDAIFFGPLDDARNRWLLEGVVGGISGYGNAVGVPTVGGELTFGDCYSSNPLVNVMCVGFMPADRLVLGRASGEGNLAVLLGSSTGRDGIGGVSVLASASFGEVPAEDDSKKRPSVQVGDPFEEKRLIEACLELLERGLVVGIQDLGGAGLACATSETAARAGMGMDVDVLAVHRRQEGMQPYEVMTSESQERMLAIVQPASLKELMEVCRRFEVTASVVGAVTSPSAPFEGPEAAVSAAAVPGDGAASGPTDAGGASGDGAASGVMEELGAPGEAEGRLRVREGLGGPVLADVPAASLSEGAPLYRRPIAPPEDRAERLRDDPARLGEPADCGADLLELLASEPDPSWVYRQYDHQLFLNTVVGPGWDATVLRLRAPGLPTTKRAVAVSVDSNPRWCSLDPRVGTRLLVAESALNVACSGARPLALVNCLNFGAPEHPEVMWELSESVDGMAEACKALGIPVVGGNVSLYNASAGRDIDPTPVVGVLGVIDRLERKPPGPLFVEGAAVVLIGETQPALAGSAWADRIHGHRGGRLADVDLAAHRRLLDFVSSLVSGALSGAVSGGDRLVSGIHDVSSGGLAVALAECAIHSLTGARIVSPGGSGGHAELFSESPGRVIVTTFDAGALLEAAHGAGLEARVIGEAGGRWLEVEGMFDLEVEEVAATWRRRLPEAMGDLVAPESLQFLS
jgi:phosphoribosylformylglycinamidine (FGAM) synthase-like enzyme